MQAKQNIAVMIGGNGSNLQALIDYQKERDSAYQIALVVSHNPSAYGNIRAANADIPCEVLDPKCFPNRQAFDESLAKHLKAAQIDWIILAGFMRILTPELVAQFQGRIINIHPSLLPKYKGLRTHEQVLQHQDKLHGCTVHVVIPELDSGPILAQYLVDVLKDDSIESLQQRVHQGEHWLYPRVINWLCQGRLRKENERFIFDHSLITANGLQFYQSDNLEGY